MGVNVVNYGGKTLVDMRNATATAETVLAGYTAYGANGDLVVGTMTPTLHTTVSVTLSKNLWIDNQQTVSVDFATADAMVIAGGAPGDQEYLDCDVWCSGQDDGLLTFSCTYEPSEDVIANIGLLTNGTLVITYATGSSISLNDSAQRKLRGLTLYGKTTQNGTPAPDAPVPLESAGDGGSIGVTVAGKNLLNYEAWKNTPITGGTAVWENNGVTITATRNDSYTEFGSSFPSEAKIYVTDGETVTLSWEETTNKRGSVFIFPNSKTDGMLSISNSTAKSLSYTAKSGITFITFRFGVSTAGETISYKNIQIERGSTATAYEPYKEIQNLTVSTPNGLPGIPVTSGGNYTDENGQQWICDEVDFTRGKYVQRIGKSVITGDTVVSVQTSPSTEKSLLVYLGTPFDDGQTGMQNRRCMTDRFVNYPGHNPRDITGPGDVENIGFNPSSNYSSNLYLRINRSRLATEDVAGVKAFLNANPINVVYPLITPIETDLTAEQISAYAALHSNSPTTTITTDSGAGMLVRYVKE